ncbi:MAG TPA: PBP1A family penicillin-binding protein [Syntrophorhabdaceae bacterium]|nr:PBP1A family penicillin-binding protein [Syntrophorhabdaceae bacterium]HQM80491.1 PBP1A family penicillin-binding protein [Syntrophorhabdaceae bacterium]
MYSRIVKLAILLLLVPALFGAGFGYALVNYLEIPDVKELESYRPKAATRLYADDNTLFAEIFVEKRIPIPITSMPEHLKYAFIAIEDVRFYNHFGVDFRGIARALYRNIMKRSVAEGASTITQQLARNLYLTPQKSMKRKIEEAILAIQIEREYSKDEILNMYLNLIYLGEGTHGVEAAGYTYFHKKAKDLTLEESATLAALTKSPSRLSPYKNPVKAVERRNVVLKRMYDADFINKKDYERAVQAPLALASLKAYEKRTGYFIEYVKQALEEHVENPQDIYTTGFNIRTTINLQMTQYAYEAIERGIQGYRKRHPNTKSTPEVALVAIEVKTGDIKVLIGGKDFAISPYNRAVQAKRQPGSAFKPIIYLAALEHGYRPDDTLVDGPISFTNPYTGAVWQPKNYRNEYHGIVTMRRALELSLNTATVRLLDSVGVENVIDLAKQLHIDSNFAPNLSLSLGTTEIAPLDLAAAYATFARGGSYLPPVAIKVVATLDGEERYREEHIGEQIVSPEAAAMLVDIMQGVIKNGTGRSAASMPHVLAGKTGTTDDFRDAWFIGFSPNLLCAVWVGYDKKTNLGNKESGATAALPIWIDFMSKALTHYPKEDFLQPVAEY